MENSDIVLDGSTATWTMPLTQGDTLGTYSGTFKFKCFLNPLEDLGAGREYRALLGPNTSLATETEGFMAYALVQLKFRILKAPPFWNSTLQESAYAGNIPDLNILKLVFEKAFECQTLFKEKLQSERNLILDHSINVAEELLNKGN